MKKKFIIVCIIILMAMVTAFLYIEFNKENDLINDSQKQPSDSNGLIEQHESGSTIVSFYKDGTIVVSDNSGNGTGKMDDYNSSLPPWNVASIGSMTKLVVEEGVKSIGDEAFFLFPIEEIEWPDSLEKIGELNFKSAYNLKLVTLPANLKEIGAGAFSLDFEDNEENTLVIPESCSVIGGGAFYNTGIHHFIIESEILTIENDGKSSPAFWIGCNHDVTIEVKNEKVKETILKDLNYDTHGGRINIVVKP